MNKGLSDKIDEMCLENEIAGSRANRRVKSPHLGNLA